MASGTSDTGGGPDLDVGRLTAGRGNERHLGHLQRETAEALP
jgi:hypothetical protein